MPTIIQQVVVGGIIGTGIALVLISAIHESGIAKSPVRPEPVVVTVMPPKPPVAVSKPIVKPIEAKVVVEEDENAHPGFSYYNPYSWEVACKYLGDLNRASDLAVVGELGEVLKIEGCTFVKEWTRSVQLQSLGYNSADQMLFRWSDGRTFKSWVRHGRFTDSAAVGSEKCSAPEDHVEKCSSNISKSAGGSLMAGEKCLDQRQEIEDIRQKCFFAERGKATVIAKTHWHWYVPYTR